MFSLRKLLDKDDRFYGRLKAVDRCRNAGNIVVQFVLKHS